MSDTDPPATPAAPADGSETAYRVLARKYRPSRFSELIGQEAMVRTLTNAMAAGRIAHAFVLTGVRGIGKTTTARLIARALNCVGADGAGGPTIDPCGVCDHCVAIAEDRHVDVLEMDAASRTGVDDMRELIEGVRYRPVSARYKVYIIDEVHMLSKAAFNALLKTLEEPPEHVKFVFATTEIRRVPVTVLSRCQRFDLRRVEADILAGHLAEVAGKEDVRLEDGAKALLARAADGSVRDGLSLLDQAIVQGGGDIDEARIRDMLGLADRSRVIDLFEATLKGDIAPALDILADLYRAGADPLVVVGDLLDFTHWLTRLKVAPDAAQSQPVAEAERVRGGEMAASLSMAVLTRVWQMLLKGLGELRMAPAPMQAAEMLLVRLAYAADLPAPADIVARLQADGGGPAAGAAATTAAPAAARAPEASPPSARADIPAPPGSPAPPDAPVMRGGGEPRAALAEIPPAPEAAPPPPTAAPPEPKDFAEMAQLFADRREPLLYAHLVNDVHPVHFESGRVEFALGPYAPANLANRVSALLREWTGRPWVVSLSHETGAKTLSEQQADALLRRRAEVAADPTVRALLDAFPGATIEAVNELGPQTEDGAETDDDADPETGAAPASDPDRSPNDGDPYA